MQDLEVLALPLSNTFPSLPALSCPFLLFTILSSPLVDGWTGGQGGAHGRTDIRTDGRKGGWTDGRTDGWTDGRMDGRTEINFEGCLQKKR